MRLTLALILVAVLSGCASPPRVERASGEAGGIASRPGAHDELVIRAIGMVGVPYRYGGRSPETGFDCSGLIHYLYGEVLGIALPRRTQDMSTVGEAVQRQDLTPGDLVFFDTLREPYSHVGMYIGDGRFIHAPSNGGRVEIVSMAQRYWQRRYNGARRITYAN